MTRKDYVLIADAIAARRWAVLNGTLPKIHKKAIADEYARLVDRLCEDLRMDNPAFKPSTFRARAGE